jgi:integrase
MAGPAVSSAQRQDIELMRVDAERNGGDPESVRPLPHCLRHSASTHMAGLGIALTGHREDLGIRLVWRDCRCSEKRAAKNGGRL